MHWVTTPDTSLPEMLRITTRASKELRAIPGVRNFGAHIGQAFAADEVVGVHFGENWISISKDADYDKTHARIEEMVDGYPGLYRDVQTYLKERIREVLTGAGEAIVVRIFGPDLDVLRDKAEEVRAALADVPDLVNLHKELMVEVPHIQVTVKLEEALRYGLKPGDVRRASATLMAGEEVGDIFIGGRTYDVQVWTSPESRHSLDLVREMLINTPTGQRVRLAEVADISIRPTPNVIKREASSRRIDVQANVKGRDLGAVAGDVQARLEKLAFPLGYYAVLQGEYQELRAARRRLNCTRRPGARRHLRTSATVLQQLASGRAQFPDPAFGAGRRRAGGVARGRRDFPWLAGRFPDGAWHRRPQRDHHDQPLPASGTP